MNVYDTANELAKEVRESEEYKEYAKIKHTLTNETDKKAKLDEFEKLRYLNQLSAMRGEQQDISKVKELQDNYAELIKDEEMKKYFEVEMKFNVMMADINKILAEAVQDIM